MTTPTPSPAAVAIAREATSKIYDGYCSEEKAQQVILEAATAISALPAAQVDGVHETDLDGWREREERELRKATPPDSPAQPKVAAKLEDLALELNKRYDLLLTQDEFKYLVEFLSQQLPEQPAVGRGDAIELLGNIAYLWTLVGPDVRDKCGCDMYQLIHDAGVLVAKNKAAQPTAQTERAGLEQGPLP